MMGLLVATSCRCALRRSGLRAHAWAAIGAMAGAVAAGLALSVDLALGSGSAAEPQLGAALLLAWSASFALASATFLGSGPRLGSEGRPWRALPSAPVTRWAAAAAPAGLLLAAGGLVVGPASMHAVGALTEQETWQVVLVGALAAAHGASVGLAADAGVFFLLRDRAGVLVHRMAVACLVGVWIAVLALAIRGGRSAPHPAWLLGSAGIAQVATIASVMAAVGVLSVRSAGMAFSSPLQRRAAHPKATTWVHRLPNWSMPSVARLVRNPLVLPYLGYVSIGATAIGAIVTWGPPGVHRHALDLWALVLPLGGLALQLAIGVAGRVPYETVQLGIPRSAVHLRTVLAWGALLLAAVAPGLTMTMRIAPGTGAAVLLLVASHGSIGLVVGGVLLPSPARSGEVLLALAAQVGVVMAVAAAWSRLVPAVEVVAFAVAATGVVLAVTAHLIDERFATKQDR